MAPNPLRVKATGPHTSRDLPPSDSHNSTCCPLLRSHPSPTPGPLHLRFSLECAWNVLSLTLLHVLQVSAQIPSCPIAFLDPHSIRTRMSQDFPGGPVLRPHPPSAGSVGWIPGQGTGILRAYFLAQCVSPSHTVYPLAWLCCLPGTTPSPGNDASTGQQSGRLLSGCVPSVGQVAGAQ